MTSAMPNAESIVVSSRSRTAIFKTATLTRPHIAVVVQEDLLEIVVPTSNRAHLVLGDRLDERVGRPVERHDEMRALTSDPAHVRNSAELLAAGGGARELDLQAPDGNLTEALQRVHDHEPAAPQHRDPICDALDF
jgi:hypothetical protein